MSLILDDVIHKMRQREIAGRVEHGATMDRDDLSEMQWLQHLQDELLDGALYVEKLMRSAAKTADTG